MKKQWFLWLLVASLLVVCWGGYRIYTERDTAAPGEQQKSAREADDLYGSAEHGEGMNEMELKLQYLGHAAFLMEVGETVFLMDPYAPNCGYGQLEVEADYVTVSHEHMDHNYLAAAPGARPIRGLSPDGLGWEDVSLTLGGVDIFTIPTYHDDAGGKLRGRNAVFVFEGAGLRLAHLGDLGHTLNQEQLDKLGRVDVLLIPVGGHFTIDASEAGEIISALEPAIVVPMHYRTGATRNWPIAPLDDFLKEIDAVQERKDSAVMIRKDALPQETAIWLMEVN